MKNKSEKKYRRCIAINEMKLIGSSSLLMIDNTVDNKPIFLVDKGWYHDCIKSLVLNYMSYYTETFFMRNY
ncbi:MAG: hypothetical protein QW372_03090 [Nitrososphaerales archaeon]